LGQKDGGHARGRHTDFQVCVAFFLPPPVFDRASDRFSKQLPGLWADFELASHDRKSQLFKTSKIPTSQKPIKPNVRLGPRGKLLGGPAF
jgi:hypothetical protein